jgi:hypothetical protein
LRFRDEDASSSIGDVAVPVPAEGSGSSSDIFASSSAGVPLVGAAFSDLRFSRSWCFCAALSKKEVQNDVTVCWCFSLILVGSETLFRL